MSNNIGERNILDEVIIEELSWEMIQILHSNVPECSRPMGWCDFSDEQRDRITRAIIKVITLYEAYRYKKEKEIKC